MHPSDDPVLSGRAAGTPGRPGQLLERWRGSPVDYDLTPYLEPVRCIRDLEDAMRGESDADLQARARRLREGGDATRDRRCEAFALVREAARRVLGLRAFDVQVAGALVLHDGKVAEMQTGEGKTLTAVFPAVLDALDGRAVHVLTFNDYLARRDAAWMGPVYRFLGVSVAHVEGGMGAAARRQAYRADVTYVTAKEAGFDDLRDGLRGRAADRVHRGFDCAIVDEADSILIDEARVPLVIAGTTGDDPHDACRMDAIVRGLAPGVHYDVDAARNLASLTEAGIERVEAELGVGALTEPANLPLLAQANLALHARTLLRRDVDYLVRNGAIELVDEFTGRVVADRHWPDGLQAAIEAKEAVDPSRKGRVLGSITLQHFLRGYAKLSGMTGTARPDVDELHEFYGLRTVPLPTNRPGIRRDLPDRIFSHREAKDRAVLDDVVRRHAKGQPVLVGTASVAESEALAARLREAGVPCQVLNARTDDLEARIVAEAGAPGAVTISTNMAGRGTDIRLGGADERDRERVVALGGLHVIGTNRHESRRIDHQLRGRAGRQGDPGSSEFFVGLDDDLVANHRIQTLIPERHRARGEAPLDHPVVGHRLDWAQRTIEGRNLDRRRTLWQHSSFVDRQRQVIRGMREVLLDGDGESRWREARPQRHARLVAACGEERAREVEQQATMHALDRLWSDHLEVVAEIREGVPLMRMASLDAQNEFLKACDAAFRDMRARVDEESLATFDRIDPDAGATDLAALGIRGPSSTWTYLVDENPLRDSAALAIADSLSLSLGMVLWWPLYVATAIWHRWGRRGARS